MHSPSPTSSINSFNNLFKNGPTSNDYLKSNKNIYFTYTDGFNTFQQGNLGDNDTFLVGTLHLIYNKPCPIKSVYLHLKGIEKTSWQKSQARTKSIYSGENTLVDQSNKIWEAFDDVEDVTTLEIPFKVQLPYNLPDSITTDIGSIQYILRATVNVKSFIGSSSQSVKLLCPLKRILLLDNQQIPPFKLCGETPNGIDYTLILPPNKSFNIGTYVSIPMRLRFLQPNVGVEKLEISLKTSMDFQSSTQGEIKHLEQKIIGMIVSRSELLYTQPTTQQDYGECTHTINLFIPKTVQPTYQGRFISIAHFIDIRFCLWGFEIGYQIEESIRICHIFEKQSPNRPQSPLINNHPLPVNVSLIPYTITSTPKTPISPQITPPLQSKNVPTPPPHVQYPYVNETNPVEITYYQQQIKHERKPLPEQPKTFYDKPFDGYNNIPQPLNYNNYTFYYQPNNSGSQRNSGSSTPSKDFETSSSGSSTQMNEMINGHIPYPTHLSPPPYRQATRQQEYK